MCNTPTHLAIPDVGGLGCLQDKAVIGVKAQCLLFHLYCSRVKLVCASHVEQTCSVDIVAILVKPVLKPACPATGMNHHAPLEHQEEVVRLLALDDPYLDRGTAILVVQVHCMQSSCTALILGRLLCKWGIR